jgi:anthranilate/para-aminobenzoate synthase component II
MQFHPESVLSMQGFHILSAELIRLFTQKKDAIMNNSAWNLEE